MSDTTPRAGRRSFASYPVQILVVVSVAWTFIQAGRYLLPPLLPRISAELALSAGQAGILLSTLQLAYAASQYPSGRLSDDWGRSSVLLPGIGTFGAGLFLIATSIGSGLLALGTVLLGVGKGLFYSPARALMADLFGDRRGRALGILASGSDVGGLLASGAAVVFLAWRPPFGLVAVTLFGLALVFLLRTREPWRVSAADVRGADLAVGATLERVLKTPEQRWLLVGYSLFFVFVSGYVNFLPTYLTAVKGFSVGLASGGFAVIFLIGMAVKPLAGAASDRVPRQYVAVTGLLLATAGLVGLLLSPSLLTIGLSIGVFSVGYKSQYPLMDAMLLDAAPSENLAGDLGAARTIFLFVGSLGPSVVGFTAEAFDYGTAFTLLAGFLLAGTLLIAWKG